MVGRYTHMRSYLSRQTEIYLVTLFIRYLKSASRPTGAADCLDGSIRSTEENLDSICRNEVHHGNEVGFTICSGEHGNILDNKH